MISIILLLSAVMIFGKCDSTSQTLNLKFEDNGGEFQVAKNSEIIITLKANPTTGYSWEVMDLDSNIIVHQHDKDEFKAGSKKLGASVIQILHFRTLTNGETNMKLVYHRPWEKDKTPLKIFQVLIQVLD